MIHLATALGWIGVALGSIGVALIIAAMVSHHRRKIQFGLLCGGSFLGNVLLALGRIFDRGSFSALLVALHAAMAAIAGLMWWRHVRRTRTRQTEPAQ